MQAASYSGGSRADRYILVFLIAVAVALVGFFFWIARPEHGRFPANIVRGPVQPEILGVSLTHPRPEKAPAKEDTSRPVIPSIAPLADRIPLAKVDPSAVNKNLLQSNADRLVVINYFVKKYNIDPLAMSVFVQHAIEAGGETRIEPLLLLAIMSIESNFNPTAQSPVGAQGLMQVMTRIHARKFEPYGGVAAALRPEANIRVGALIIKQAIALMGSLQGGLYFYVGAASPDVSDGGFAEKVLREYDRLLSLVGRGGQGLLATTKPLGVKKLLKIEPDGVDEDEEASE